MKSQRVIARHSESSVARTVALRGNPSKRAISPKKSPGPSVFSNCGLSVSMPLTTSTVPELITKKPAAWSPSLMMISPALAERGTISLESRSRSRRPSSANIGTFFSISSRPMGSLRVLRASGWAIHIKLALRASTIRPSVHRLATPPRQHDHCPSRRGYPFPLILQPHIQFHAGHTILSVLPRDPALAYHRVARPLLPPHLEPQALQETVVTHPVRDHAHQRRLQEPGVHENVLVSRLPRERRIEVRRVPVLGPAHLQITPPWRYVERESFDLLPFFHILPVPLLPHRS